ncbi:MAG: polyphosphate kinase 1 [Deltaproteobacteria bacterium]|nr:polyphosphate kinase 1 [Deltaproteobacteria bacterium]
MKKARDFDPSDDTLLNAEDELEPFWKQKRKKSQLRPDQYINRELGWLEFNRRVLLQAADPRMPLLERVNFLSIFTSNLDEFVMKRVGLLKRQIRAGITKRKPDGLTPVQQLDAIRQTIRELLAEQARIYSKEILPELAGQGIFILGGDQLEEDDAKVAEECFRSRVFPVLTPLAVDPGHPFPFLSNLSTSLGVTLRLPGRRGKLFARVKVPEVLPAYLRLSPEESEEHRYISLVDLISRHIQELFPGMEIRNFMPFRITRNADIERDEEDAEDLLDLISQELKQRRFERIVRLEHGPGPVKWMLRFLMEEMGLTEESVYQMPALLDYTSLRCIASLPIAEHRFQRWAPIPPKALAEEAVDIFSLIRRRDLLVHHPYESFDASVGQFVTSAADDPHVVAIKLTLYRTAEDSPFIPALIRAAESGKQVVVLVELKARFDEQRNIRLAQALEEAGVHVVYGMVGLKTHTKTTLVVRNEPEGLRCYAHIGTGNYHIHTAKLYTDLSLLTCRRDLTQDLVDLFHFLTGRSLKREYRKLLVAPVNMKDRVLAMIQREAENAKVDKPARIIAKMNSLEDQEVIAALYDASGAGVPIELLVRGFCCLRPGVRGMSENIRVSSIIGRFLEHSRIFYFAAGQEQALDGEFYMGSADWMYRNLQSRVEVVTPVEANTAKGRLWQILEIMLSDQRQTWEMQSDGRYAQRTPSDKLGPEARGTHRLLMDLARKSLLQEETY